jgi:fatty-acyl-CoA synthase
MRGRMMAFPLTVPSLLRRTATLWRDREIVCRALDRSVVRTTYGATLRRARQLAVALRGAGVRPGDRVATLCWNCKDDAPDRFSPDGWFRTGAC